ncbi:Zinc finger HIT-type [Penicillium macrosclerotiorum]|uniref:Zinc finger HIT-type n=1 Tax=Penicillium macrosclerotiorum TaxID=303699 RepID=UPI002548BBFA|nr:Zinc finger HIT-type [Penicillium macrosclerotiorum]KAJ5690448.1 Zinc finger HIT-type [Penicillium macrosclerotiorum]
MDSSDPLLSELCSICHVNPPKYRCPRCSTRTCSLPCTRRHKLWSQCSGERDPAAYLKRSQLATESAFDRDFNFISGIERTLERAERDVENRGIDLAHGQDIDQVNGEDAQTSGTGRKRKHPGQGLVKGEAGFLRGAEAGAVKVIRAPKGMSRNKQNNSRWHPKKAPAVTKEENESQQEKTSTSQAPPETTTETTTAIAESSTPAKALDEVPSTETQAGKTEEPETQPEPTMEKLTDLSIGPHRDLYFYLHRPRTATKKPVLIPLPPSGKLAAVLRERTVLEFPTIYTLPYSAETLLAEKDTSPFILEEEYLRTAGPEQLGEESRDLDQDDSSPEDGASGIPGSSLDLQKVDEKKVLEVLKQDLFEPVPDAE